MSRAVRVVEGMADVAAGGAGLRIFDVTNPADPVAVGGYGTIGNAYLPM